jgi:hypothetical protein
MVEGLLYSEMYPDNGGSTFLWNLKHQYESIKRHARRAESSNLSLPQIMPAIKSTIKRKGDVHEWVRFHIAHFAIE